MERPDPLGRHEMSGFEHTQVFHDSETGHRGQHLAKICQRLAIALRERIKQRSATVVGQCFEDFVHSSIM